MPTDIRCVVNRGEQKQFLDVPPRLYRGDPNWVSPLRIEQARQLDPRKNPFLRNNPIELRLAVRDGTPVGRIALIHNTDHNRHWQENIGFFGLFEAADGEVAATLLATAETWARESGFSALRGPTSLSTNEVTGLLTVGFDSPPMLNMAYNPPAYVDWTRSAGFAVAKVLYAWYLETHASPPERVVRVCERLERRASLRVRPLELRDLDREAEVLRTIYNDAWSENWGFVPLDKEGFRHLAKNLKPLVDRELAMVAEVDDEPAGFSISMPDYNEALISLRDGRLLPTGIWKILWKSRRRDWRNIRLIVLGVRKRFDRHGIPAFFYLQTLRKARELGYFGGELSWTLEDNHPVNNAIAAMGGRIYKQYEVYEKKL